MTSESTRPRYHTFLSHSTADKPIVERLARTLKEAGLDPWLDKWNLIPGSPWQEQIEQALADCDSFCVFIGPREIGPWQNAEMRTAIDRRIKSEDRFSVIPVLLPNSQRPERSKLPTFLTQTTWVELRQDIDDEEGIRRLICAIKGIAPGAGPGQEISEGGCPYRGLEVFDVEHAAFFFGREALTEWALDQLRPRNDIYDNRFLAIIGPSGSGKSSFARAGLVAALNDGVFEGSADWPISIIKPGADPLETLAVQFAAEPAGVKTIYEQFRSDDRRLHVESRCKLLGEPESYRLVILVDQFEQIFTICQDPVARRMFIDNLLVAANEPLGQTFVILTMRADFYGRCAEYPALAAALTDHQLLVGPMEDSELRAAIAEPATLAGSGFESGLVETLIDDVKDEAGGLPLLQFTLTEMWQLRTATRMTFSAYLELGGVRGTLQKRAEEMYETLSPPERDIAKQVFLELTQLGEGVADTRRQLPLRTLRPFKVSREAVERVIARLSEARLVVVTDVVTEDVGGTENEVVDVAHEALIRHWPRLREWIDGNRFALKQKREIEAAAATWLDKGKPSEFAYLLQGTKLDEARNFVASHAPYLPLSITAQEYVTKSTARRKLNRVGAVASVAAVFSLVTGAAVYAFAQSLEAQRNSVLALVASAQSLYASDKQLEGMIEAVRAARVLQNPFVDQSDLRIRAAAALNRIVYGIKEKNRLEGHTAGVSSLSFHPDGQVFASASQDRTIKLWGVNGSDIATLSGHQAEVSFVSFSPDGRVLASAGYDGTIRLWNPRGEAIDVLSASDTIVHSVSFSPTGDRLASSDNRRSITLWDSSEGVHKYSPKSFELNSKSLEAVFNPFGKLIATANVDGGVSIRDLDGKVIQTLSDHRGAVTGISFSPDNKLIASAGIDHTVKVWTLNESAPPKTLAGHSGAVLDVVFSPDGKRLASAGADKTVRIWGRDGKILYTLKGHTDAVPAVRFAPDGASVVSASRDGTIRLWRLDGVPKTILQHEGNVYAISFSPDNQTVATASLDGSAKLWTRDGRLVRSFPHDSAVLDVAFSPDGRTIGTAAADGSIYLWTHDGRLRDRFNAHDGETLDLEFSPDGSVIASAGADRTARLWSDGGDLVNTLPHETIVARVAFSNTGGALATMSSGSPVKIWSRDGRLLQTIHSDGGTGLSFGHEDELLAHSLDGGRFQVCRRHGRIYGKCVTSPRGHRESIFSLDFGPDGETIVSAGADDVVRLWTVKGEFLAELSGHGDFVRVARFSGDGTRVASASLDNTGLVWNLDLEDLAEKACIWLGDYLSNSHRLSGKDKALCLSTY